MKRIQSLLMPATLALLLAACGGGNDQPAPQAADPLAEVPASASQSAKALATYVSTLATLPAETREPAALESFNPTKAEETEPEVIG